MEAKFLDHAWEAAGGEASGCKEEHSHHAQGGKVEWEVSGALPAREIRRLKREDTEGERGGDGGRATEERDI